MRQYSVLRGGGRSMARHTPVIGLTAIAESVAGEWREADGDCGLVELVGGRLRSSLVV
jgi:hypothetical protein